MSNLTALYVEDDDIIRENFEQILLRYFSKVLVASDGITAFQLFQEQQPAIALLDISIPHLNGLQLARKIREVDQNIEIIMLTAYTDQEKLMQAVNLQLFAYLVKPISQIKLDTCLRNVINKYQTAQMLNLANGYFWDKANKLLFYENEKVKLTKNECLIVDLLCRYPNRYFTTAHICSSIGEHDNDREINYNSIVQIISRFKNKILKKYNTHQFFIQNTYGAGYRVILEKVMGDTKVKKSLE